MIRRALLSQSAQSVTNKYLTIEALEDGLTASLSVNACEYCVDGDYNWKTLQAGTSTVSINAGQTLSFRGQLTPNSSNGIGTFTITKKCNLSGNCMSMLFGDDADVNFSLAGKDSAFRSLFEYNKTIINVSPNFLPATTLVNACYLYTFRNCSSMLSAPNLPATTIANNCYYGTFRYCSSLTTAPVLPSLSLYKNCYYRMFQGCTVLNYIEAYFLDNPSENCVDWVTNVASKGTFVKNSAATWNVVGTAGVPSGWTIIKKNV